MRRQASRNSAVSVSAQRPLGSPSWGGSAAKRETKRSSGGIGGGGYSKLEQERHRAVVDQLDLHQGAEHATRRPQPFADLFVERLGVLRAGGVDVGRPVALAAVAVERELRDAQHLAVAQRLVHPPLGVREDAQRA